MYVLVILFRTISHKRSSSFKKKNDCNPVSISQKKEKIINPKLQLKNYQKFPVRGKKSKMEINGLCVGPPTWRRFCQGLYP